MDLNYLQLADVEAAATKYSSKLSYYSLDVTDEKAVADTFAQFTSIFDTPSED